MRNALIFICSTLWLIAGVNVVRIGIQAKQLSELGPWATVIGIVIIFILFGMMFLRISLKNIKRIKDLPSDRLKVWNCMPWKSFAIMVFMISFGIWLRSCESVSRGFITFFYIGLGSALALAGCVYLVKGILNIIRDKN